jgi:FkbM family methyltransferase
MVGCADSPVVIAWDQNMSSLALGFRQRLTYTAHLYKAVFNQYHMAMRPMFARHIPETATVFDVGAQAAQFTKHFAALATKGHVYAFEPGVYARRILTAAVRWRGMHNVTIVPVGLSDRPGEATLVSPIKKGGSIGFGLSHLGPHQDGPPVLATTVALTTLDTFVAEQGIQRLDFLKADIEGWEIHMLRGGLRALARFHPTLLLEINRPFLARAGSAPEEAWAMLGPMGYRAESMRLDGTCTPVDGFAGDGDYLFVAKGN